MKQKWRTKRLPAFVLLLASVLGLVWVSQIVGADPEVTPTPIPLSLTLEQAAQAATEHIARQVETGVMPEWKDATTGEAIPHYDLNGGVSAYVFSVLRDQENSGYIVVSSRVMDNPIVEFSKGEARHKKGAELCKTAAEERGFVIDKKKPLYLGPLSYYYEVFQDKTYRSTIPRRFIEMGSNKILSEQEQVSVTNRSVQQAGPALVSGGHATPTVMVTPLANLMGSGYIPGVPANYNRNWQDWSCSSTSGSCDLGCGPCATGAVVKYWADHGFPNLVSSGECTMLWRMHELLGTNCAGWSYAPPYFGATTVSYFQEKGYSGVSTSHQSYSVSDWAGYSFWKGEINAQRPVILTLFNPTQKFYGVDHIVAGMGYNDDGSYLIVHDNAWYLNTDTYFQYGWGYDSMWIDTVVPTCDTTPPSNPTSIWSTSHSRWSWSSDNTIEVCWSGASDDGGSGVDGYSYEWSTSSTTIPDTNKEVEESTNCVTSSSLSDSNNWYFHIRTRDNAGNWNSGAAHHGPFYIDATGPTIDFYSTPQTNHWYNTDQRVSWRISDGHSGWLGFSQNWDSDPGGTSPQFYTYEGFMDFSYIPEAQRDGKHWAYVRAWDQLGNQRMERSGEYWYDATAPTNPSIIINDDATYTNDRNVSLALSASDPTSGVSQVNLRNEGESWAGWRDYQNPYSWTLPSGDGTKTVHAQFKDAADNTSDTDSDDIVLDTTPPDTTITSGPQGDIPVGDACFSWTGSDNITPAGDLVYRYRLLGSSDVWSDWDGGTTVCYSDLPNGDYTFEVKARDLAGNEDGTPASRSFFVDTTPPDTSITSGPSGCIGTADVAFTWTGSDNRTPTAGLLYSFKLEGFDAWSPWTGDTSKSYTGLPDGDYTFKVKAKDGVGHEDPSPVSRSFRVDTTPPTGSILVNGGDSTTNKISVHLDISGNDGPLGCGVTEMCLSNDGFNWEAWESFATEGGWLLPTLNRTTWTVHLQLKDLVGNVSEVFTDDIYLDLYPPRPSSASYQLGARVMASADPTSTSESYGLLSATMGQPIADGRMQGAGYRLESGYQGAWPSVPRGRPPAESYDINASLTASGGGYRISETYRLQSAMGQSTNVGPRSSEKYQLLSGYLPCKLLGDLNVNGRVDVADIMMVASRWRCRSGDDCYHERYDLDKDDDIDIVDIMLVVVHWGESCP